MTIVLIVISAGIAVYFFLPVEHMILLIIVIIVSACLRFTDLYLYETNFDNF